MTRRTAAFVAWGLAAAVIVVSILIVIEGVRPGSSIGTLVPSSRAWSRF